MAGGPGRLTPTVVRSLSPDGRTKRMCEEILADLSASDSRWLTMSLRYTNPSGAHPSGYIGEVSCETSTAALRLPALTFWGSAPVAGPNQRGQSDAGGYPGVAGQEGAGQGEIGSCPTIVRSRRLTSLARVWCTDLWVGLRHARWDRRPRLHPRRRPRPRPLGSHQAHGRGQPQKQ